LIALTAVSMDLSRTLFKPLSLLIMLESSTWRSSKKCDTKPFRSYLNLNLPLFRSLLDSISTKIKMGSADPNPTKRWGSPTRHNRQHLVPKWRNPRRRLSWPNFKRLF
jgi:hypothetical protein